MSACVVVQVPAGSGGAKAGSPLASDKLKTIKVRVTALGAAVGGDRTTGCGCCRHRPLLLFVLLLLLLLLLFLLFVVAVVIFPALVIFSLLLVPRFSFLALLWGRAR